MDRNLDGNYDDSLGDLEELNFYHDDVTSNQEYFSELPEEEEDLDMDFSSLS